MNNLMVQLSVFEMEWLKVPAFKIERLRKRDIRLQENQHFSQMDNRKTGSEYMEVDEKSKSLCKHTDGTADSDHDQESVVQSHKVSDEKKEIKRDKIKNYLSLSLAEHNDVLASILNIGIFEEKLINGSDLVDLPTHHYLQNPDQTITGKEHDLIKMYEMPNGELLVIIMEIETRLYSDMSTRMPDYREALLKWLSDIYDVPIHIIGVVLRIPVASKAGKTKENPTKKLSKTSAPLNDGYESFKIKNRQFIISLPDVHRPARFQVPASGEMVTVIPFYVEIDLTAIPEELANLAEVPDVAVLIKLVQGASPEELLEEIEYVRYPEDVCLYLYALTNNSLYLEKLDEIKKRGSNEPMPMTDFLALQWEQHVAPVQLQLKKTETKLEEQKDINREKDNIIVDKDNVIKNKDHIIEKKDLFIHTYSWLVKSGRTEDAFKMEEDSDFAEKMIEDYMQAIN